MFNYLGNKGATRPHHWQCDSAHFLLSVLGTRELVEHLCTF